MSTTTDRRTDADKAPQKQDSMAAGHAAGYCWVRNPRARGRCTWPPRHSGRHKDAYAGTEW